MYDVCSSKRANARRLRMCSKYAKSSRVSLEGLRPMHMLLSLSAFCPPDPPRLSPETKRVLSSCEAFELECLSARRLQQTDVTSKNSVIHEF